MPAVQEINYPAAVNRIARQTIRLSMLNFQGRIFLAVVHGILLSSFMLL